MSAQDRRTTLTEEPERLTLAFRPKPVSTPLIIALIVGIVAVFVGTVGVRQPDMLLIVMPIALVATVAAIALILWNPTRKGVAVTTLFDLTRHRIIITATPLGRSPHQAPRIDEFGFDEIEELSVVRMTSNGLTEIMQLVVRGRRAILLAEENQGARLLGRNTDRLGPLAHRIAELTGLPRGAALNPLISAAGTAIGVTRH